MTVVRSMVDLGVSVTTTVTEMVEQTVGRVWHWFGGVEVLGDLTEPPLDSHPIPSDRTALAG